MENLRLGMVPDPDQDARAVIEEWVEFLDEVRTEWLIALRNPRRLEGKTWEEATEFLTKS